MSQEVLDQIKAFLSSADGPQIILYGGGAVIALALAVMLFSFALALMCRGTVGSLKLSWLLGRGSASLLCRGASWSASKAFGWMVTRQPQELARTLARRSGMATPRSISPGATSGRQWEVII